MIKLGRNAVRPAGFIRLIVSIERTEPSLNFIEIFETYRKIQSTLDMVNTICSSLLSHYFARFTISRKTY